MGPNSPEHGQPSCCPSINDSSINCNPADSEILLIASATSTRSYLLRSPLFIVNSGRHFVVILLIKKFPFPAESYIQPVTWPDSCAGSGQDRLPKERHFLRFTQI